MDTQRERVGLAIVRAVVEPGSQVPPVIHILRLDDVMGEAGVIGRAASAEEAASILCRWLRHVIEGPPTDTVG